VGEAPVEQVPLPPRGPWLQLQNPVLVRELLTTLREPKSFALLVFALLVSAIAVLSSWPDDPSGIAGQGELSRQIFRLFGAAQMLILGFVIPGTLAAAMTSEKEKETLDLLLTTPLRGDTIVFGKLLSGLGYLFLIGLASLPVLLLCSVIGGLAGKDVLQLYTVLALQGAAYGLTAICCSAFSRRTVIAVMISYLLVAIEAAFFVSVADSLLATLTRTLIVILPTYALARTAVRRPYNPVPKVPKKLDATKTSGLVLREGAFPDNLLLPPPRKGFLPDSTNPILHKELAAGIHGAGGGFVRALVQLGLVVSLGVFLYSLASSLDVEYSARSSHPGYIFHCFVAVFAMTLGPAIGARAFSGEREQGTAEMLCLVLLPRPKLVAGKFLAHFRVVCTLTAINCVPFLGFAIFTFSYIQLGVLACVIVGSCVFSISVGFWASLVSNTTVSAMFRSYVVLFVAWVFPALAFGFVSHGPAPTLEFLLRVLTPLYAADVSVPARGAFPTLNLVALCLHMGLTVTASGFLLRHCANNFDAHMRHASER
jgi:ABC-type transport system involved in multi-copper enzyme maturation permease subunit